MSATMEAVSPKKPLSAEALRRIKTDYAIDRDNISHFGFDTHAPVK